MAIRSVFPSRAALVLGAWPARQEARKEI